jgi:hypothetical protein
MTLSETVLQKVADWRPAGGDREILAIAPEGSGWSVAVTVDRKDDLGCLLWEVTVKAPANRANMTLQSWAYQMAENVRGLLERLKVVEIDVERREAMLRSDGPSQRGDQLAYYEIMIAGTADATLRRYRALRQGNQRRQQVPFTLTHEVLAKVVGDMAS